MGQAASRRAGVAYPPPTEADPGALPEGAADALLLEREGAGAAAPRAVSAPAAEAGAEPLCGAVAPAKAEGEAELRGAGEGGARAVLAAAGAPLAACASAAPAGAGAEGAPALLVGRALGDAA